MSYDQIIAAIKAECAKINLNYETVGDGRLLSAAKEEDYLNSLKEGLQQNHPSFKVIIAPPRHWYDIEIEGIPINLKISSGGTDNAFNKVAIIHTLCGTVPKKRNMNYNQFFAAVKECKKYEVRTPMTEYHYLVVNKSDGKILLKSILDIHTYHSNPCNDLQINWAQEFAHIDYKTPNFKAKILELLLTVQTSVRQALASSKEFAEATLDTVFQA